MISRSTKLRLHRHYRRGRKQVENIGSQAEEGIDEHIVDKLSHLLHVWRFVLVWLGLLIVLSGCVLWQARGLSQYYQTTEPVAGGIYTEGILGDFSNANPVYASGPVDRAVSRLVFSGLFTYNDKNQLVGDLAKSWSVDSTGKVYTVKLKPNLTWQDGQPLTAADVLFTYQTIQNPDAQSPLNSSWQNVTVAAPNTHTVTFTLTNSLSSFPYSLTNGIIPKHLLGNISPSDLRTASFNTAPVGSGPFEWKTLAIQGDTPATRQQQITLTPFDAYNLGKPKLKQLVIRSFHDKSTLVASFENNDLDGVAGLDNMPAALIHDKSLHVYNMPLTAANMVFFKTTSGVLSDTTVRQVLVQAANVPQIINGLGYPVIPVNEPLLIGQVGYNPAYAQVTGNPPAAEVALQKDGWIVGKDGIRYKNGQPLSFGLDAADTQDNRYVAIQLQRQWKDVGAKVNLDFQTPSDLQDTASFHNYDALLYGISIGVDPDVFVYWDSSQADINSPSHLNFSEYKSSTVDQSLEAGRTRTNPALRAVKYQPFLKAWQQDAPALGLYQPRFLYITHEPVYGLTDHSINEAADRFDNVQDWAVRLGKVDY